MRFKGIQKIAWQINNTENISEINQKLIRDH